MTKKIKKNRNPQQIPQIIIQFSAFLAFLSTKWVTLFAAKLFTTPLKHKIPKRELEMDSQSQQSTVYIPSIQKKIQLYQYGNSPKKVLLVHGWSGRGTQLFKIADALINEGYATISFDAPGHGKSAGNSTIMTEFIETIKTLDQDFGPFEIAIGHSLGGMSVLNAIRSGVNVKQAIVIGSGDVVQDILDDFIHKLRLKPTISQRLRVHFEKKYGGSMDDYSAHKAAATLNIPVLVIHDENDIEVPVKAGINIYNHLKNGTLFLTEGLGHRKILGDNSVIEKIISFIKK